MGVLPLRWNYEPHHNALQSTCWRGLSFTCSILVYSRNTLHETYKNIVDYVLLAAGTFSTLAYLITVHLVQWLSSDQWFIKNLNAWLHKEIHFHNKGWLVLASVV